MSDAVRDLIRQAMSSARAPERFKAYAPSNIALSKYWGKQDRVRNLPLNSSLSISLAEWGSYTVVAPSEDSTDHISLNGEDLPAGSPFAAKALKFVDLFRGGQHIPLRIDTRNTIPTAAGLASSASGFAALTKALCGCFGLDTQLDKSQLSLIARLGSGSATRSIWHGFVRWNKGARADGRDSFATPLDVSWPEFRIAILPVDVGPKAQSSRDGMNHTVETSPLFAAWPQQAEADCVQIEAAVLTKDFATLGALAEANALAMHATMQAARPSLTYLNAQSWALLDQLWSARNDGLNAYATMDAGANVKLIYLESEADDVIDLFPQAQVIEPFGHPEYFEQSG